MESTPPTGPPPPERRTVVQEPVPALVDDGDRPARLEELRTLRRWLLVTGIWAIAATAVAVFALLEARDAKDQQDSAESATEADIERVQGRLRDDVDELGVAVRRLPTHGDLSRLQVRVRKAQRDATSARDDATQANDDSADVQPQVEALERKVTSLETRVAADSGGN